MELEIVRTINGRKATRAKAWRICETGVTYHNPGLARAAPSVREKNKLRLDPNEQAVLDALKQCGPASLMKIRDAMPVKIPVQEAVRILNRLTSIGLAIERSIWKKRYKSSLQVFEAAEK